MCVHMPVCMFVDACACTRTHTCTHVLMRFTCPSFSSPNRFSMGCLHLCSVSWDGEDFQLGPSTYASVSELADFFACPGFYDGTGKSQQTVMLGKREGSGDEEASL